MQIHREWVLRTEMRQVGTGSCNVSIGYLIGHVPEPGNQYQHCSQPHPPHSRLAIEWRA